MMSMASTQATAGQQQGMANLSAITDPNGRLHRLLKLLAARS
jgi:hypothetical protein